MSELKQPLRWGILGTAKIAQKVRRAIGLDEGSACVGIASRSPEKAAEWGKVQNVPRSYGGYEALLDDPEIEAVYIPLPPSIHHEWTIRTAEAGKHVLCEKPLAVNHTQASEMAAACREHGVQLMDGVMWQHHPRTKQMIKEIERGALGNLRRLMSGFSFCWDPLPVENIRLQSELGGGALLDLGWYCVGCILWASQKMPTRVEAHARWFQEVDCSLNAQLWFENNFHGIFDCGFETTWRKWFELAGTSGSLVCDDFVAPWSEEKSRFWLHDSQGKATEWAFGREIQEREMIVDFRKLVRGEIQENSWLALSLKVQKVCDALAESARKEQIVELS
ncbi:MAG: Gfo/Idh/MocA family oxidoreductase [Planctomycetales bacterium]